jgi:hypothetical protein
MVVGDTGYNDGPRLEKDTSEFLLLLLLFLLDKQDPPLYWNAGCL